MSTGFASAGNITQAPYTDEFVSGTGNDGSNYILTNTPTAKSSMMVFIDGFIQKSSLYTIAAKTLTFTTPVTAGGIVHIFYITGTSMSNAVTLSGAALSTDVTFADNSDAKLPTEKATKTLISHPLTISKTATYIITDTDGYLRYEFDLTGVGADQTCTLPLMANNAGRRIEIALLKNNTTYKLIVKCNATDANKLSNDALDEFWLVKAGDFLITQHSATSALWEIVNERITSELRMDTYAGYGNVSNNKIPYFTLTTTNVGNMHTLTSNDSATGCVLTINRSGRYAITLIFGSDGSARNGGITLTATAEMNVSILSVTSTKILAISNLPAGYSETMTVSRFFAKGDVIRPHTEGVAPTRTTDSKMMLSYLGN